MGSSNYFEDAPEFFDDSPPPTDDSPYISDYCITHLEAPAAAQPLSADERHHLSDRMQAVLSMIENYDPALHTHLTCPNDDDHLQEFCRALLPFQYLERADPSSGQSLKRCSSYQLATAARELAGALLPPQERQNVLKIYVSEAMMAVAMLEQGLAPVAGYRCFDPITCAFTEASVQLVTHLCGSTCTKLD